MPFWPSPTFPTARVEHTCSMCGRTIAPGETYKRGAGFDAGSAWTWKECEHCQALLRSHPDILDWIDEGYNCEDVIEWEPDSFLGKLRQARFRHQWRHGNGDLVRVWPHAPLH